MKVYDSYRVPLKLWPSALEEGAMAQAEHLASLPFAYKHVALMPDAHQGYGMPIGGVLATKGVVIPNAVGVDIGCGMRAICTSMHKDEWPSYRVHIMHELQRSIPTGFRHHDRQQEGWLPEFTKLGDVTEREYEKSLKSIGTLGGGNHFIEVQHDEDGNVWFMVHSGSRNLGKQVCDHYGKRAKAMNARWHSDVCPGWDLAFLPLEDIEAKRYLTDMENCLTFAHENRRRMMKHIEGEVTVLGHKVEKFYDTHHNFAAMENHFGVNVMVHRKGAVRARKDEMVIIPGSMGTHSYIAKGLGSPDSFQSCSHGAGRCMGRMQARRVIDPAALWRQMEDLGVALYTKDFTGVVEEAPGAYKDIDVVMSEQSDLVSIVTTLTPMACIKA